MKIKSAIVIAFLFSLFTAGYSIEDDEGTITGIVHPNYKLVNLRKPFEFIPMTTGLWLWSPDSLLVTTAVPNGSSSVPLGYSSMVYLVTGVANALDSTNVVPIEIAKNFREIMGIIVVDNEIYVSDKHALIKLAGMDTAGYYHTKDTIANYPNSVSVNPPEPLRKFSFHEFPFGPLYRDGFFYVATSASIQVGGYPWDIQPTIGRSSLLKINKATGEWKIIVSGLRTPAGIGWGPNGTIWIADNEGGWNPTNSVCHVIPGQTYGYPLHVDTRIDLDGVIIDPTIMPPTPCAVLAEEHVISESLGELTYMPDGKYAGQFLTGDMSQGGVRRVFVEKVNGQYQGAIFSFSGGFEVGSFRSLLGLNGEIYVGGIGNGDVTNWGWNRTRWGLQKLVPLNNEPVFEILAVRLRAGGIELEFTQPLAANANIPAMYKVKQWWYHPTIHYGGPERHPDSTYNAGWTNANVDLVTGDYGQLNMTQRLPVPVDSAVVSPDNKSVFLKLSAMRGPKVYTDLVSGQPAIAGMVTHIQLDSTYQSAANENPWIYNAWYTINALSESQRFTRVEPAEIMPNGLKITTGPSLLEVDINEDGNHSIQIFAMDGKNIVSRKGDARQKYTFSVKNYAVYFIRVTIQGRTFAEKKVIF